MQKKETKINNFKTAEWVALEWTCVDSPTNEDAITTCSCMENIAGTR